MDIKTHATIDKNLCGTPVRVQQGLSSVELKTTLNMEVDGFGLVHGGFVFGLADHAAMLAVNHPNVVLGAAEVMFQKPVAVGEVLRAEATLQSTKGKKNVVTVDITRDGEKVFAGTFTCFILERHVLEGI